MKYFHDVVAAFTITNADSDQRTLKAIAGNADVSLLEELLRNSTINGQAYFVLLFTQLETEVNRLCEDAIWSGRNLPDWTQRRAWDVLGQKDVRNIHFMDRVALLTDKGRTVYKLIKELYDTRNKIAHGDLLTEIPDVAETAKDIERIVAELNEAS